VEFQRFHAAVEHGAGNSQESGGLGLVAFRLRERSTDQFPFDGGEMRLKRRDRKRSTVAW
jgi:hypothetical protein